MMKRLIALLALLFASSTWAVNPYYSHASGVPSTGSAASSSVMRSEFDAIATGFNLLPTLSGNGNLPIFVDGTGSFLTAISTVSARTNLGLGSMAIINSPVPLANGGTAGTDAATARTNLGVTATGADTTYAYRANNLSDIANAATARTNLGLGTVATQNANAVTITGGTIAGISSMAVTGTSSSTKACAAGYTRIGPNYCSRNSYISSSTTITSASGCTSINTASVGASDVQAVVVEAFALIASQNASGLDEAIAYIYDIDNTCTTPTRIAGGSVYEFTAKAGAITIGKFMNMLVVRSTSTGAFYVAPVPADFTTGSSLVLYTIGYYD